VSEAAAREGYCRRHALRRLQELQKRNPEFEVLIPRSSAREAWLVNPVGFRHAVEAERKENNQDVLTRMAAIESAAAKLQRKTQRLEMRISSIENNGLQCSGRR
jgi:hypothetical protein